MNVELKKRRQLRPLPAGALPLWLVSRLNDLSDPVSGPPSPETVASAVLTDRQALRWALSRHQTCDRIKLALFARFVFRWELFAASYYAKLLKNKPKGYKKRVRLGAVMAVIRRRFFGHAEAPGWAWDRLKKNMRKVKSWKRRNPYIFDILVTGKLPKPMFGEKTSISIREMF